MRRKDKNQLGFVLDTERGYWAKNDQDPDDSDDPLSQSRRRVIPYVEDRKNSLLFEPVVDLSIGAMASLQAALKHAIQLESQLEDNELAAEPLPMRSKRNLILFYEAAEGGAGVLRQLIDDPTALQRIASRALELCHFEPTTGADNRRSPHSKDNCEAACYDCLMSYTNQLDHPILDRAGIREYLIQLRDASVISSPTAAPRAEQLDHLNGSSESSLEKRWLRFLEEFNLRLPTRSQVYVEKCSTRPDFLYDDHQAAIYVDGPHHDYPERQDRDKTQEECMENAGWTVIRFHHSEDWLKVVQKYPNVFGSAK